MDFSKSSGTPLLYSTERVATANAPHNPRRWVLQRALGYGPGRPHRCANDRKRMIPKKITVLGAFCPKIPPVYKEHPDFRDLQILIVFVENLTKTINAPYRRVLPLSGGGEAIRFRVWRGPCRRFPKSTLKNASKSSRAKYFRNGVLIHIHGPPLSNWSCSGFTCFFFFALSAE